VSLLENYKDATATSYITSQLESRVQI